MRFLIASVIAIFLTNAAFALTLTRGTTSTISTASKDNYPAVEDIYNGTTTTLIVTYRDGASGGINARIVDPSTLGVGSEITITTKDGADHALIRSPLFADVCYAVQQYTPASSIYTLLPHRIRLVGSDIICDEFPGYILPSSYDTYDPLGGIYAGKPSVTISYATTSMAIFSIDERNEVLQFYGRYRTPGVPHPKSALCNGTAYCGWANLIIHPESSYMTTWDPIEGCSESYMHEVIQTKYGLAYSCLCREWGPKTAHGNMNLAVDGTSVEVTDLGEAYSSVHSGIAIIEDSLYVAYNVERIDEAWDENCGVFIAKYNISE